MSNIKKREVAFERVIFFSDAIVAIAITLLALDLKLQLPEGHHLTFKDLLLPWKSYLAFCLSFINVASFWRTHHQMYTYIHRMNEWTMTYNTFWLFFIVILPYSTSLLSTHFGDSAAIFFYSLNIFALSVFQNLIWDSSEKQEDFIDTDKISDKNRERLRVMFNFDMINGLVCIVLSFVIPKIAFFFLFFKIPIFILMTIYIANNRRKDSNSRKEESM